MDLHDYWQENRSFVVSLFLGLLVFTISAFTIHSVYGGEIQAVQGRIARLRRELAQPMHTSAHLDRAGQENERLLASVAALEEAVRFEPREGFRPGADVSPANRYLRSLSQVREELLPIANRRNLALDPGIGMPELSPTREEEIVRYLEALDLVDTTVRMAAEAGVRRIDKLAVRLDPGLRSRTGLGRIERTRVELTLVGTSGSLVRLLRATQRAADGRPRVVEELELVPSRSKEDEVRLDLTLLIARPSAHLTGDEGDGEEEGA